MEWIVLVEDVQLGGAPDSVCRRTGFRKTAVRDSHACRSFPEPFCFGSEVQNTTFGSTMPRSIWKAVHFDHRLMNAVWGVVRTGRPQRRPILTTARWSTIIPQFVGFEFGVHNGRNFVPVNVTSEMVGHKFGDFSFTRKMGMHAARNQK